jgi:hypothetical protein
MVNTLPILVGACVLRHTPKSSLLSFGVHHLSVVAAPLLRGAPPLRRRRSSPSRAPPLQRRRDLQSIALEDQDRTVTARSRVKANHATNDGDCDSLGEDDRGRRRLQDLPGEEEQSVWVRKLPSGNTLLINFS